MLTPRQLVLIGAALLAACGGDLPESAPVTTATPVPIRVSVVAETTLRVRVTGTGVLRAKEEVPLGFKIGGVVARVLVDEGQQVRHGDLLAVLEQPEIASEVAKAEAGAAQAERDLHRAEILYRDSVIARAAWEGAGTAAEVARSNLRIARFNAQYAEVRAPSDGIILRRMAEPGQQIAGGTAVLVLARAGRGQVIRVGLADQDRARVRLGDRATVRFQSGDTAAATGRVTQLGAAAAPGTGAWPVEIQLDHMPGGAASSLTSGLIGNVEIWSGRTQQVQMVPLSAVLEGDGDQAVIYTVAAGVARRHAVTLELVSGGQAVVWSGLGSSEAVVTEGAAYLQDGVPVVIRTAGGAQ